MKPEAQRALWIAIDHHGEITGAWHRESITSFKLWRTLVVAAGYKARRATVTFKS